MGMSVSGGMIVGAIGSDFDIPEGYDEDDFDLAEWSWDNGMSSLSPHYDSDVSDRYIGFPVDDVDVSDIDNWVYEVKELGEKFRCLTGLDAKLFGSQDVN